MTWNAASAFQAVVFYAKYVNFHQKCHFVQDLINNKISWLFSDLEEFCFLTISCTLATLETVNFLDVTLDLTSGSYKPFMKPNNKILYVHRQSNHPPALLKNIPENINKRLTSISYNQKVFDDAIPPYQKALDVSGFKHKLTYIYLFSHLIATVLKFLYLIATLSSLLIASSCNLTVIHFLPCPSRN